MQELRPIEHPQLSDLSAMRPVCHISRLPFKCALLICLHNSIDSRDKFVLVSVFDEKFSETGKPVQSLRNIECNVRPARLQFTRFQKRVLDFVRGVSVCEAIWTHSFRFFAPSRRSSFSFRLVLFMRSSSSIICMVRLIIPSISLRYCMLAVARVSNSEETCFGSTFSGSSSSITIGACLK